MSARDTQLAVVGRAKTPSVCREISAQAAIRRDEIGRQGRTRGVGSCGAPLQPGLPRHHLARRRHHQRPRGAGRGQRREMREFAFTLIRKSASQASAKLQFARLAFGAAGFRRRRDRPCRCREGGARLHAGREGGVRVGISARANAEKSGQAAAQPDPARRDRDPARVVWSRSPSKATPRRNSSCARQVHRHALPPAFEKLVPGDIAGVPVDAQSVQAYYTGAWRGCAAWRSAPSSTARTSWSRPILSLRLRRLSSR